MVILEAAKITKDSSSTLFWSSKTIYMSLKKIVFIQKLDGVAPLIKDPPAMNSTDRENPLIQQNCRNSLTKYLISRFIILLKHSLLND